MKRKKVRNATELAAVRAAISDGTIVMDAFPLSAQPEIYSKGVFSAGLKLVADLADALNTAGLMTELDSIEDATFFAMSILVQQEEDMPKAEANEHGA